MEFGFGFGKRDVAVRDLSEKATYYMRRHQISVRLAWGQVALWHNHRAIINWLNPLVWCWHGNGLHRRGAPIEIAESVA